MCFYYYTNNTNNTNPNVYFISSRYFSKKTSEKRPLNLERRSKIMCFLVHSPTTYSEHAIEPCLPSLKLNRIFVCLIDGGHLNYHSYYSDTHVILYYGIVQSRIYVGPTKNDCMK
jgi:hypothetical protein